MRKFLCLWAVIMTYIAIGEYLAIFGYSEIARVVFYPILYVCLRPCINI